MGFIGKRNRQSSVNELRRFYELFLKWKYRSRCCIRNIEEMEGLAALVKDFRGFLEGIGLKYKSRLDYEFHYLCDALIYLDPERLGIGLSLLTARMWEILQDYSSQNPPTGYRIIRSR